MKYFYTLFKKKCWIGFFDIHSLAIYFHKETHKYIRRHTQTTYLKEQKIQMAFI